MQPITLGDRLTRYPIVATGQRWPCRHEGVAGYTGSHDLLLRFPALRNDPRYVDYGRYVDEPDRPVAGSRGGGLFPVLAKTPGGTLVCIVRTGASHKNTAGAQISLTMSTDRGRTWSPYRVIVQGGAEQDARNPALGVVDDNTFVVAYGVHNLTTGKRCMQMIRSTDAGRSWSSPTVVEPPAGDPCPWLHPHGQMCRPGPGRLVFNARGAYTPNQHETQADLPERESFLYFSDDHGASFTRHVHLGPITETAVLAMDDTRWLCYSRNTQGSATVGRSADAGQTWGEWTPAYPDCRFRTDFSSYIAPGSLVRLPSGNVLLVHTYRDHPFGVRAVISRDGAETFDWDRPFVITDSFWTFDSGYPSAVCFDDGMIVCAAYTMLDLAHPEWGTCAIAYVWHERDMVVS